MPYRWVSPPHPVFIHILAWDFTVEIKTSKHLSSIRTPEVRCSPRPRVEEEDEGQEDGNDEEET